MGGVDLAPITIYIMGLLIAGTLYSKINLRTRFVAVINRGEGGPRSVGMPETGLEVIVQKRSDKFNQQIWSGLPPPPDGKIWQPPDKCTGTGHKVEEPDEHLIINCQ